MRRVALPPELHRGGLLGMGSVLALTSHTSRTSPTLRGKWVLEVDLRHAARRRRRRTRARSTRSRKKGEAPKTFREQMAQHARQADVRRLPRQDRPAGLRPGELRRRRPLARPSDGGRPLDASGELPGGRDVQRRRRAEADPPRPPGRVRAQPGRADAGLRPGPRAAGRRRVRRRGRSRRELEQDGHRFSALVLGRRAERPVPAPAELRRPRIRAPEHRHERSARAIPAVPPGGAPGRRGAAGPAVPGGDGPSRALAAAAPAGRRCGMGIFTVTGGTVLESWRPRRPGRSASCPRSCGRWSRQGRPAGPLRPVARRATPRTSTPTSTAPSCT